MLSLQIFLNFKFLISTFFSVSRKLCYVLFSYFRDDEEISLGELKSFVQHQHFPKLNLTLCNVFENFEVERFMEFAQVCFSWILSFYVDCNAI